MPQHVGVEKEQRREGLVLCGGSHVSLGSQIREERLHIVFRELARVPQAVVAHIASRPPNVGLFRTQAEVLCAACPAHLVEQLHGPVGCLLGGKG